MAKIREEWGQTPPGSSTTKIHAVKSGPVGYREVLGCVMAGWPGSRIPGADAVT